MFERSRNDSPSDKRTRAIAVELRMVDGRVLKGHFFATAKSEAYEELNDSGGFIDFESYNGDRELVSKASISAIRLLDIPKADQLKRASDAYKFDPHSVLNVPRGAQWETIRETYHQLSKLYHPDRYANLDLPDEVKGYLDAMSRRVNAAFSALEKPHQVQREYARAKSEPIYQRG